MNDKLIRKWAMGLGVVLALLIPVAVWATVTIGAGHWSRYGVDQAYTLSVYCSSTDSSKVITLPKQMGPPDCLLWQQAHDNATAGRAKTAIQNGEIINFTPNEYAGASLSDGQLTIYRTDLDGNDTLTSDVWFEITFGYLYDSAEF